MPLLPASSLRLPRPSMDVTADKSHAGDVPGPSSLLNSAASLNMFFMFAKIFDQDIKTWDTKKVANMKNMFKDAADFNKELGPGTSPAWDLSAVTSMEGMFEGAAKFNNADVDSMKNWDTKKVTNMKNMFKGAAVFNLALTEATPKWDTGEVTTMENMFNR